jgi:hypothetical protein
LPLAFQVCCLTDVDDALRLLGVAKASSDRVLEKAIAEHAYRQAAAPFGDEWSRVLQQWAGTDQTRIDGVNELADLDGVAAGSVAHPLASAMAFHLSEPSELRGWRADIGHAG